MPRDIPDDRPECPWRTRECISCGCKPGVCVAPTADQIRAVNAQDANIIVLGGKQCWVTAGTTQEWHGDTYISREHHFDGRPTKVTTIRNGRRKVTYEH